MPVTTKLLCDGMAYDVSDFSLDASSICLVLAGYTDGTGLHHLCVRSKAISLLN